MELTLVDIWLCQIGVIGKPQAGWQEMEEGSNCMNRILPLVSPTKITT